MMHDFENGSERRKEFINTLAEKLGVPPEKVTTAIQEARKEKMDGMVTDRIQAAVQNGLITQAEADQIQIWWINRPAAVKKLRLGQMHGGFHR